MKGEGYRYEAWSPINQRVMTLVCFGFMDNTDLILNNDDPIITSEDLIDEAQLELSMWEGLISATGEALAQKELLVLGGSGPRRQICL